MKEVVSLEAVAAPPTVEVVLGAQGVPENHEVPAGVKDLIEEAREIYRDLTAPRGILRSVSTQRFLEIYEGEGLNEFPAPVPEIVARADHLALFVATLGMPVCERIKSLFEENDPALGAVLDTIASRQADQAADALARHFGELLVRTVGAPEDIAVLPYSPGYCGWHVTGQRKLFAYLQPEEIDVTLNDSCLMTPIKSVSGVLVAGRRESHDFNNDFDFCLDCVTWECRSRISSLFQP